MIGKGRRGGSHQRIGGAKRVAATHIDSVALEQYANSA